MVLVEGIKMKDRADTQKTPRSRMENAEYRSRCLKLERLS